MYIYTYTYAYIHTYIYEHIHTCTIYKIHIQYINTHMRTRTQIYYVYPLIWPGTLGVVITGCFMTYFVLAKFNSIMIKIFNPLMSHDGIK